jgi:hypothetical protein
MTDLKQIQAINNRVWYVEGGVHPARAPQFLAIGKFSDDPAISIGEDTKISAPDPNNFGRDITVGTMRGAAERATLAVGIRTTTQKSILLDWKNKGCRVDLFALMGKCGNPQDFTEGGEKWVYFLDGKISGHGYENFGAYGLDENNPTNEAVPMTAEDYYEFLYMRQDQIGSSVTTRRIFTVHTYQGDVCEDCPDPCSRVLMTMAGAAATPGTQPSLLFSDDGGENFSQQTISTLFSNEDIVDDDILGGSYLILSNTANEIHWTDLNDLYNGASNTWNQVPTGFVAAKNPNAMSGPDVRHLWIVGNGGYVYFASNFKVGVEVQDAGVATTQHLQAVHAFDTKNVLAVGNSNAVIFTSNGGSTWESVTGPAVGVNLGACSMWNSTTWLVGEGAGGTGKLWLTQNSGISWSQIGLPATYSRIYDIIFVSEAEGYLIASDGSKSYVLRTITGGYEWVVLPQGKKGTPIGNTYLTHLAVCSKYANTAYAVGLASNGTAGIAVKMTGA